MIFHSYVKLPEGRCGSTGLRARVKLASHIPGQTAGKFPKKKWLGLHLGEKKRPGGCDFNMGTLKGKVLKCHGGSPVGKKNGCFNAKIYILTWMF